MGLNQRQRRLWLTLLGPATFIPLILLPIKSASLHLFAAQSNAHPRTGDNSDWWSSYQGAASDDNTEPQEREISVANFEILGVTLDEKMFDQAAAKLGKAEMIDRGDASTGRSQACYVSASGAEKVYLIFEQGEVDSSFYLFVDGQPWDGRELCHPSNLVSSSLATSSGLRLGLSPSQVIAILGKPTKRLPNELIYSLHARKKTSARDLQNARKEYPDLSEKKLIEDYGFYDLGVGVGVKFLHSRLTYLTIGKSETN